MSDQKKEEIPMKSFIKFASFLILTYVCAVFAQTPKYPNHREIRDCYDWCKLSDEEKKKRSNSELVKICGDCSNHCFKDPESCDTEE